ncbi:MAG: DUF424 domain-containing protein [Thermoplasmata archaeon]|nr:MAG: DUF424 family protein [Thermoplasmata archaeon]RLF34064.1 MAG: DUF424 domain-containing protein [Thermoplasmata archaeon]RLF38138.1 MAG: DUF424 domain-containing protein [Thermoplasmata archaeon]
MKQSSDDTASPASDLCIRVYTTQTEILVAACDRELLGKTLNDGDIEFHVSREFYRDIISDEEMLKKHLEGATIANLVGHRAVKCGIEMGLIDERNVLVIAGVPHAQFALL